MSGDSLWLPDLDRRPSARLRLVCLPAAGGSPAPYRSWQRLLPPEVAVCPVVLPGRERRIRETPWTDMGALADAISARLLPLLDRPLVLLGHSLGAWIGYEVALRLDRRDEASPVHLIAAACAAPQIGDSRPPLHQLPDARFVEAVDRFGGTPREVLQNQELLRLTLPALRADFTVYETYSYEPSGRLSCAISAWGGDRDPTVEPSALEAWRERTSADFEMHWFEGGHFFLFEDRRAVLDGLERLLVDTAC